MLLNIKVREKIPFEDIPTVDSKAREIEEALGDRGRLLLRYSGTERLARVMVEGENEQQVNALAKELAELIRDEIGEVSLTPEHSWSNLHCRVNLTGHTREQFALGW